LILVVVAIRVFKGLFELIIYCQYNKGN